MLLSMTGHGQATFRSELYSIDVEVRTVNNRYLKLTSKLSDCISPLESEIEGLVRAYLRRGSVSLSVRVSVLGAKSGVQVNEQVLASYVEHARRAAKSASVPLHIDWASIFALPGVLDPVAGPIDDAALNEAVLDTCRSALTDLQSMRQNEGASMLQKFQEYLLTIRKVRGEIELRTPSVSADYEARLEQKVRNAFESRGLQLGDVDLVREITLFCDRVDVSEELTRLQSHIGQFESALAASESQGRRLDFLVQELGRETNTIGSKANDSEISAGVVTIKTILEQIRELVQNVE